LLLVGREEDTERSAPVSRLVDRGEQQHEARLHVVDARPARDVAFHRERHRRERAFGPDGVRVPHDRERRARPRQVCSDVAAFEDRGRGATFAQLLCHDFGDVTDAGGARRRLDLDEPS
jgi:hypothetical protein